jgi:hypothetical protein
MAGLMSPGLSRGSGPAIHVFAAYIKERRGWPAHVVGLDPTIAGHDDDDRLRARESQSLRHLVLIAAQS